MSILFYLEFNVWSKTSSEVHNWASRLLRVFVIKELIYLIFKGPCGEMVDSGTGVGQVQDEPGASSSAGK